MLQTQETDHDLCTTPEQKIVCKKDGARFNGDTKGIGVFFSDTGFTSAKPRNQS